MNTLFDFIKICLAMQNFKSNISIDSLKIRIPFAKVQILNESLTQTTYEVDEDNVVLREFKRNSYKVVNKGISTHYGIENQIGRKGHTYKYLVVLFNSKLLKTAYLDGLLNQNIRVVYDALMSHKVVYFSSESFISGECTDVDFKLDYETDYFDKIVNQFSQLAKPSQLKNRGYNKVNKSDNKGIEFGNRNTATPSYPFLKYYHKTLELYYNSTEFYESYKFPISDNLSRLEFTIKNRKHFAKYGIKNTTLENILSLSQEKLKSILSSILSIHLEKRTIDMPLIKDLSPSEAIFCSSLYFMLDNQISLSNAIDTLTQNIESKVAKSRQKKKLRELYEYHIKDTDIASINQSTNTFFDFIGWN
jgi:hypothetical protein